MEEDGKRWDGWDRIWGGIGWVGWDGMGWNEMGLTMEKLWTAGVEAGNLVRRVLSHPKR